MFLKVQKLKTIGIISIKLARIPSGRDMQDIFYSNQSRYFIAHAHHLYKCAIWKITNHQYEQFLQEGFFVMRLFHLVHTVFFTKWKVYIDKDVSFAEQTLIFYKEMFGKSKFASFLFSFTEPMPRFDIYWDQKQKPIIELLKEPVG
jgi:hypothetical protein